MKLSNGWAVCASLVLSATAADAQIPAPSRIGSPPLVQVSDFDGPYAAMPPQEPVVGNGPMLLPPQEVYAVLRDNGFSPLGIPRLRGLVYTISVLDPDGEDGRLVIDARNGRIIRFMPAFRMGSHVDEDIGPVYGPAASLPPTHVRGGVPRPPASIPHVASRTVVTPKPSPLAARTAPVQQSAAVQPRPAEMQASPPATPAMEAKPVDAPASSILPTQEMPKVQGLD
jgi:hypothetical protein